MSLDVIDSNILQSPLLVTKVKADLSIRSTHFDTPIMVYTLTIAIESNFLNFSKLANNLHVKANLDHNSTLL